MTDISVSDTKPYQMEDETDVTVSDIKPYPQTWYRRDTDVTRYRRDPYPLEDLTDMIVSDTKPYQMEDMTDMSVSDTKPYQMEVTMKWETWQTRLFPILNIVPNGSDCQKADTLDMTVSDSKYRTKLEATMRWQIC